MKKHPLLIVAIFFACGILLFDIFKPPLFASIGLLVVFTLVGFVFRGKPFSTPLILCAVILAGGLNFALQFFDRKAPDLHKIQTYQKIEVIGFVYGEVHRKGDFIRFPVSVNLLKSDSLWKPVRAKLFVSANDSTLRITENENLFIRGNLVWPIGSRNPGDFDYKRYLLFRGIDAQLRVRRDGRITKLGDAKETAWTPVEYVKRARRFIDSRLETVSDSQTWSIMRGLLLGDRSEIDPEITEEFARSGIIHILAVSGLHVGLLMGVCFGTASLLGLRKQQIFVVTLIIVWFYAVITGLKPPVTRASLMATLFLFGKLRDKQINGLNIVGAAALCVLIFRPGDLFQVGFQLSFSAVLGILLLYPRLESGVKRMPGVPAMMRNKIGKFVLGILMVSLAAQIGTAPFSVWHFGRISLVGVGANLLAIPLVTLLLPASLLYLATALTPAVISDWTEFACHFLAQSVIVTGDYFGRMAFASIDNWRPPLWWLPLYISVVALIFYGTQRKIRFIACLALFAGLNLHIWQKVVSDAPELRITVLDVGQGDCIFVEFPNGKTLLVDAGPASPEFDAGERYILPFLERHGFEKIDMAVISHPHLDHFGGLVAIASKIQIKDVVFADLNYESEVFQRMMHQLDSLKTPSSIVRRGDVIDAFAPATIMVFGPSRQNAARQKHLNDASIALQIRYGETTFLFTGDAEEDGEAALIPYADLLRSQFLKAGHHGSRTSSTNEFLQHVQPRWTAMSLGAMNKFGHPNFEVTQRLAKLGSDTLRTDLNGALQFVSNGRRIERIR